jgi:hypothetical protein
MQSDGRCAKTSAFGCSTWKRHSSVAATIDYKGDPCGGLYRHRTGSAVTLDPAEIPEARCFALQDLPPLVPPPRHAFWRRGSGPEANGALEHMRRHL